MPLCPLTIWTSCKGDRSDVRVYHKCTWGWWDEGFIPSWQSQQLCMEYLLRRSIFGKPTKVCFPFPDVEYSWVREEIPLQSQSPQLFRFQKIHQPKERRRRSGICLRFLSAAKITNIVGRKHHSTIAETFLISKVFKVLCHKWNSYHDS